MVAKGSPETTQVISSTFESRDTNVVQAPEEIQDSFSWGCYDKTKASQNMVDIRNKCQRTAKTG